MGLFGGKSKVVPDGADYKNMGPGAWPVGPIPVATPVEPTAPSAPMQAEVKPVPIKAVEHAGSSSAPPDYYDMHDPSLTRNPMMMRQCPNCNQESRTRIETHPTGHSFALAILLLFLFWPLCWVPLVLDSCKRTNHFCVLCNAKVGVVQPFQNCCVERRG